MDNYGLKMSIFTGHIEVKNARKRISSFNMRFKSFRTNFASTIILGVSMVFPEKNPYYLIHIWRL